MTEITGTLENWTYDSLWNIVWGNVYNDIHNRFPDGSWIHTSAIPGQRKKKEPLKEGDVVKTLNSTYKLGKPQRESDD